MAGHKLSDRDAISSDRDGSAGKDLLQTKKKPHSPRPEALRRARKVEGIASRRIIAQISGWLHDGKLKQGDFLGTEDVLARRFGVSKIPVRDALRALQAVGLVDIRVGAAGGNYVSEADPTKFANALGIHASLLSLSLQDMLEAQLALELAIVEKAARQATPKQCDLLQVIYNDAKLEIGDSAAFIRKCHEFHMAIADISESRMLAVLLDGVLGVLFAKFMREHTPLRAERVLAQQALLLDQIRAGDATAAASQMKLFLGIIADDMLGGGGAE